MSALRLCGGGCLAAARASAGAELRAVQRTRRGGRADARAAHGGGSRAPAAAAGRQPGLDLREPPHPGEQVLRSEEHTSELQSLMRTSYAVFCLKKKKLKQE